jgi:hypothetical protein
LAAFDVNFSTRNVNGLVRAQKHLDVKGEHAGLDLTGLVLDAVDNEPGRCELLRGPAGAFALGRLQLDLKALTRHKLRVNKRSHIKDDLAVMVKIYRHH